MKIALAGFGQEGKASYEYWNHDGNTLTIVSEQDYIDDAPKGVQTITGPAAFSKLDEFDLVIRSPGINPKKLPYGERVWSATNEFFEKCPAQIIGVTGTKGKGTTSSMIAGILNAAGETVHLVGNIGVPALSRLGSIQSDDIVVYELSSFQLWDARKSPHVAVVLMIEPDHLDVHDSMNDYLSAKANITAHQHAGDEAFYNPYSQQSKWIAEAGARTSGNPENGYDVHPYISERGVHVAEGYFYVRESRLLPVSVVKIPGAHNLENACAAIQACLQIIGESGIKDVLQKGLSGFEGLPHRLKFVTEKHGVKYFDDSIATTPGSAIAALASFDEPKIIILGGKDKGAEYDELIEACYSVNATVVAIGANGPVIARLCGEIGATCIEESGDMSAIVMRCADIAEPGSVVILSPAASSFDMFKSYTDRGDQFVAAVSAL